MATDSSQVLWITRDQRASGSMPIPPCSAAHFRSMRVAMSRKTSVLAASLVLALGATYQVGRTQTASALPHAALSPHPSEFRESGPIARVVRELLADGQEDHHRRISCVSSGRSRAAVHEGCEAGSRRVRQDASSFRAAERVLDVWIGRRRHRRACRTADED